MTFHIQRSEGTPSKLSLGTAAAWGALGTALGQLLTVYVPSIAGLSLIPLAAILGTLLPSLYGVGLLRRFRPNAISAMKRKLLDVDRLFIDGLIDEREYQLVRQTILDSLKDNI